MKQEDKDLLLKDLRETDMEEKVKSGEPDEDKFCKDNCKGYQQTHRCFADGRCKVYIENEKDKHQ